MAIHLLSKSELSDLHSFAAGKLRENLKVRPTDKERAERGFRAYYRLAGLPEPKKIVWAPDHRTTTDAGPLAALMRLPTKTLRNQAKTRRVHGSVDTIIEGVVNNTLDQLRTWYVDARCDAVVEEYAKQIPALQDVEGRPWNRKVAFTPALVATMEALGHTLSLVDSIDDVNTVVKNNVGLFIAGWCFHASYPVVHLYYRDILNHTKFRGDAVQAAEDASECLSWWPHQEFVVATERPVRLCLDPDNRLHSGDGLAFQYSNGEGVARWHGTEIPKHWVLQRETLTAEEVLGIDNTEQRRCGCEILGWDKVLNSFPHKVIDKDPDESIGTLFSIDLPDAPDSRYVQARCGTGRMVWYQASPEAKTALEAAADSYQLKAEEYLPEVRT